jgi:hypothetical protein
VLVTDRLTVHDKRRTSDGYLVTEARFARTGIYEYAGRDVGKPEMAVVHVYRPEDEVFSADAMASFAHKPVTNNHPTANVTAATWKRDAVGFTDGRVARDGDFVAIPMMVADQQAIDDVDSGKVELSAGYTCDLDFIDGTAPDGSHYDAVMKNIRGNHVALVDRGRAGSECRIGDSFVHAQETAVMNLQSITLADSGISIETTSQGAQAISRLQDTIAGLRTSASELATTHATALAAKDTELATKDAEIADLKAKVLDTAALDKLVADRAALVGIATKLVPTFDAKGKDSAAIKREVVLAKRGADAVQDKADAYVDAAFDILAEAAGTDSGGDRFRDALMSGPRPIDDSDARRVADEALAQSNDFNGWRKPKAA